MLDPENGDVYAVPKAKGVYTAWLIATDLGGTARDEGLPAELDEIVLKRWTFTVSEVRLLLLPTPPPIR